MMSPVMIMLFFMPFMFVFTWSKQKRICRFVVGLDVTVKGEGGKKLPLPEAVT